MKNRAYLILLALADSDLHGLAIARAVQELSDGRTRLWPASLYGTLGELTESGLIEELDDPRDRPADESEKKRFYRLTRAGHRALAAETARLAALIKIAKLAKPSHVPGVIPASTFYCGERLDRRVRRLLDPAIRGESRRQAPWREHCARAVSRACADRRRGRSRSPLP